ncbi:MAG: oxidoreductase, partial [Clostridia bacterium]|nr:oxidoreductase [Clostridia bacterium]
HGIYRPGGSALNAGQVGSMRCAQYISKHNENEKADEKIFDTVSVNAVKKHLDITRSILGSNDNLTSVTEKYTKKMSEVAGPIRNASLLENAINDCIDAIKNFTSIVKIARESQLYLAYRLRDALIAQSTYMVAMNEYVKLGGKSRGSAIYSSSNGQVPAKMEEVFRFELDDGSNDANVLEITYNEGEFSSNVRKVRPLPEGGGFFENVWREYRTNKNIY